MIKNNIGLIAGNGQFPILFARTIRDKGMGIVAVAINGEASPALIREVDLLTWVELGELGKLIKTFKQNNIKKVVMCGGINKIRMFSNLKLDLKSLSLINKLDYMTDDNILRTLAQVLYEEGINVISSYELLPDLIAKRGSYTKRVLNYEEFESARLGWRVAGEVGRLDIGQAVVVKNKVVLAIEAIEGTDSCIRRGGSLAIGEVVVIKRCKPLQDLRFDLPSIGLNTVEVMIQSGASCLIIEAGRTLIFDRKKMVEHANKADICITAWTGEEID